MARAVGDKAARRAKVGSDSSGVIRVRRFFHQRRAKLMEFLCLQLLA